MVEQGKAAMRGRGTHKMNGMRKADVRGTRLGGAREGGI
jgi:hypothetical protein